MEFVLEEDIQNAIANLGNEKSTFNVERLSQQLNRLQKKIDEMGTVWKTEQSTSVMKDIYEDLEEINFEELYTLINTIQDMKVDYQINIVSGMDRKG